MGDIVIRQNLSAYIAKAPASPGSPIIEKDFSIDPTEQVEITDFNEDECGRFQLAASAADVALGLGTVALGRALFIRVESAATLKIVNGAGTSQSIELEPGRHSVMHMKFTGLLLSNPSGTAVVKGRYAVAGD